MSPEERADKMLRTWGMHPEGTVDGVVEGEDVGLHAIRSHLISELRAARADALDEAAELVQPEIGEEENDPVLQARRRLAEKIRALKEKNDG